MLPNISTQVWWFRTGVLQRGNFFMVFCWQTGPAAIDVNMLF
jgi:hypothetical protein